ncbi:MAG TPA: hypothetical protein VFO16_01565 [Pseudonocardiaceae bacterium]|nr:hypothetical protein [Pseudonocardiaceae bacterium]
MRPSRRAESEESRLVEWYGEYGTVPSGGITRVGFLEGELRIGDNLYRQDSSWGTVWIVLDAGD